ncbi:MAG TPA: hypothetical protein VMW25_02930 [Clostridia bacterium]|nr:hypothetical protein [Clostridia bacterium]
MEDSIPNLNSEAAAEAPASKVPKKLGAKVLPAVAVVAVLALGVFTGWWFAGRETSLGPSQGTGIVSKEKITKGSEYGSEKAENFKDKAIGVLEAGGIEGEGTHKLIREGGPSQTVYLTSSVLDLDQFIGRKLEVLGETMTAQKAGWLMDVGRVKVLE